MKDKLEKAFNEALDNHELPYDAAAWNAVKKQLPAAKTPWYWLGGAAAVVLAIGLGVFLYDNSTSDANQNQLSQTETMDADQAVNADLNNNNSQLEDVSANDNNQEPNVISQGSGYNDDKENELNRNTNTYSVTQPSRVLSTPLPQLTIPGPIVDPRVEEWVQESNKIEVRGLQNVYCENGSVTFKAVNLPKNSEVYWVIGKGEQVSGDAVTFNVTDGIDVELHVFPKESFFGSNPIYGITWKINTIQASIPNVVSFVNEKNTKNFVTLSNTNPEIEHLVWRIDNKVCKEQTCGAYLVSQGTHNYTVESYDRNGCFASVSGSIEVEEEYTLYVQSGFTPNGDGLNDVFLPEALKMRSVSFKMTIFDRNGKVLYETTDASLPWDGTLNGQTLEPGAYVWSVSLINEEGLPEQYRGVVTLLP